MALKHANYKYSRTTGTNTLETVLTTGINYTLVSVRFHLSADATQDTFKFWLDSSHGGHYDVVFIERDMTGHKNIIWTPPAPISIQDQDRIRGFFTNNDGLRWGLEVVYREGDQ